MPTPRPPLPADRCALCDKAASEKNRLHPLADGGVVHSPCLLSKGAVRVLAALYGYFDVPNTPDEGSPDDEIAAVEAGVVYTRQGRVWMLDGNAWAMTPPPLPHSYAARAGAALDHRDQQLDAARETVRQMRRGPLPMADNSQAPRTLDEVARHGA